MGCGGSVDVQHSSLYLSEPFLVFLALFGLGLKRFFVREAGSISGSCCGHSYLTKIPHLMIHL